MSVRSSIRKFLAIALTFLLTAAAIFLPARLSQWNDRLLLDEPHILQEEREGFGESVGLTVAGQPCLRLRSGAGLRYPPLFSIPKSPTQTAMSTTSPMTPSAWERRGHGSTTMSGPSAC